MPYPKNSSSHYRLVGGINEKASEYATSPEQALNLKNLDMFVPGAISKTPGSTQAVTAGHSGPIRSLYEYVKLNGASFIVASGSTQLMYAAGTAGFTTLTTGYNNDQPWDMLTYNDRLYACNGQTFISWGGTLPLNYYSVDSFQSYATGITLGGSQTSVFFGLTNGNVTGGLLAFRTFITYVRQDGTESTFGQTLVTSTLNTVNLYGITGTAYVTAFTLTGMTVPAGLTSAGVTAIAINAIPNWGYTSLGVGLNQYFFTLANARRVTLMPVGTTTASFLFNTVTSWTALSVYAGATYMFSLTPRYIDISSDTLFMSGFSSTPSDVWYSDVGSIESVQPDNTFEIRSNDGDRITAQQEYQNQMLFWKQKSFWRYTSADEDAAQLINITNEYGCLSNNAVVQYNDILLFLDEKGIVEYNGASWRIISDAVEDSFRTMNLSAAIEYACAVHYQDRKQVWFGIPVNGSTVNNLTVVYDYALNAWSFIDGFSPASFAQIKGPLSSTSNWFGNYSGMINYMSPSFFAHNGVGMTCVIETVFDAPDGRDVTNMFRRLFLDVNTQSGVTGVINVEVVKDFNRSSVQATFAVYQSEFQTRADFGVMAKAVAFKMYHNNVSLPLTINGYDVQRRFLRKV
jgi:hypothetical protein